MLQDIKKNLPFSKVLTNDTSIFWNVVLDKGTLKSFISWFLENYGEKKTLQILEELKTLGFGYATKAGISLGIEDLKIPPKKINLLANSERLFTEAQIDYRRGSITGIEKMQLFIETWTETSETLKDEVVSYFEQTDVLNPVYMMAFSGARGNMSQVRQLVGMRGLMSDPQGKIIDFPIQSNFREGLTLTEYLISTYGARKGIVDTALRTATAGYLTRRLVDVAQHVVVSKFDCETKRGIFLFDMKEGVKTIYSFQNRLIGRVLAQDIFETVTLDSQRDSDLTTSNHLPPSVIKIASRNQELNSLIASKISKITKKALVRSPLTCQTRKLVCQLCYGWSLATSKLVAIGEAVGVIAGQSIGEPGTQLTMRTFHTGGVFSSTITEQINSPFDALIEYSDPIAGTCVRTSQGNLAFLTKSSGTLFCKKCDNTIISSKMYTYKIPAFTLLFARHGQFVKKEDLLAQVSAFSLNQKSTQIIEQTIYSSFEGEVYYRQLDLLNDVEEKYGERTAKSETWAQVWVLAAKILKTSLNSNFFPYCGDYVSKNSVINQIEWVSPPSNLYEISLKNQTFSKFRQSLYTDKYLKNDSQAYFSQKPSATSFDRYFKDRPILNLFKSNSQKKDFKDFKDSFQILSNCKLRNNFFVSTNLLFQKNDLETLLLPDFLINFKKPLFSFFPKALKPNSRIFEQFTKQSLLFYKTEIKKTEFHYPYQRTTRFYMTKFLTKTNITLPLLKPGSFKIHFRIKTNKTTLLNEVKKPSLGYSFKMIRNFSLNKKFRTVSKLKQNFLCPLIFSNTIPFYLKSKSLKTYLYSKKLDTKFQSEVLKKRFIQKLGNQTQLPYLSTKLKLKGDPQFSFQIENRSKLNSSNNFFNLKGKSNLLSTQVSSTKFENFSFKTSLLSLKTYKTFYKKLGYFSEVVIENGIKEKFFSLLPLNPSFSMNSNRKNFIQLSSNRIKDSHFNSSSIKTFGLENTYEWRPNSTIGFKWFPDFSKVNTPGVFLRNPSYFLYMKSYTKSIVDEFKPLKSTLIYIDKYQNLLNLSHSQIFKKNNFSNSFSRYSIDSQIEEKQSLKNFIYFFQLPLVNRFFRFGLEDKILINFSLFKIKPSKLRSSIYSQSVIQTQRNILETFDCLKFEKNSLKNMFLRFLISPKRNKNFLATLINQKSFKGFLAFKKFTFSLSLNDRVKYSIKTNPNLNFDLIKCLYFKKKTLTSSYNLNLVLKFNPFEKPGIIVSDLEFIPQDNYVLKTRYLSNFENQIVTPASSFSFLSSSESIQIKPFNFYLTNAQGFKKQFLFFQEGFLSLKKSKLNVKPINVSSSSEKLKISTKKTLLKNQLHFNKITEDNFEDSFLINFKKLRSRVLLRSPSFFQQEKIKNLELFSRLQILEYLKSQTPSKVLYKISKFTNFQGTNIILNSSKSSNSLCSFIPFLKQKKWRLPFEKQDLSFKNKKRKNTPIPKIQQNEFELNIKPGWVYKISTIDQVFNFHKKIFEPGTVILDSVSFSDKKIMTEIIRIEKIEENFSVLETQTIKFSITQRQKNLHTRFLKIVDLEKEKEEVCKIKKFENSVYLLIRPFDTYQNLSLQDLKTTLYDSSQRSRLIETDRSYFLYKQYFSQNFNPQTKFFRTLSTFAPLDLKFKLIDLFSFSKIFYEIQKDKISKFRSKVKNERNLLTLKEKNLRLSFYLLKFLLNPLVPNWSTKLSDSMIYKPKIMKTNNFKRKKFKTSFPLNTFYFSNYPINFSKLRISLNVSNLRDLDFSFSKILFTRNGSNIYLFQDFSQEIYKKLKINYLNLLIRRNHLKYFPNSDFQTLFNFQHSDSNITRNLNSNHFLKSEISKELKTQNSLKLVEINKQKFQNFVLLGSFLSTYSGLPRFQYIFDHTYSFLGNQKILANSFYKDQHKLSLNLNFFKNAFLNLRNLKNKEFLEQHFKDRAFSESYYFIPKSRNTFIFQDQSLKLTPSFSLTNFYSPFDGEVLKDYLDESNLENLKKSVNINIEEGLLSERQAEKLILTKADIFSLSLPISKKFVQPLKIDLNSLSLLDLNNFKQNFFNQQTTQTILKLMIKDHQNLNMLEQDYFEMFNLKKYTIPSFQTIYRTKHYKVKNLNFYLDTAFIKFRLGNFVKPGTKLYSNTTFLKSGQIIHLNSKKITLRKAEFFSISPKAILHTYNGHSITKNTPVMTLPFETLKTGDIVQGIPKVEQYLEARTTIQGRLFLNSLPVLLHAIYKRYSQKLNFEKAVRQSFLKIQQILVDGVQRVYRSQGVSIADKHLEIIVRQMTSKVKIVYGGQTGFFAGELVELEFIEKINQSLIVKIQYEPIVLGITRSSLEVDSFLSAASFQQTTKVLTKASLEHKKDFLKGLKENLLVGNLLPAGTGYLIPLN